MLFQDILGHKEIIASLRSQLLHDMIAQSYLFAGPKGIGKRLLADRFARGILCLGEDKKMVPCGSCASCIKAVSGNHPDLKIVDQSMLDGSIGIDEVRRLCAEASLKPYEAIRKVFIIDGIDRMTEEASNAFLKTLEEPNRSTTFLLTADRVMKIPRTIISRVQVLKCNALPIADCEAVISSVGGLDGAASSTAARFSCGAPGLVLGDGGKEYLALRERALSGLERRTFFDSEAGAPRDEVIQMLEIALTWYRDILVLRSLGNSSGKLINADRSEALRQFASQNTLETARHAIEYVVTAINEIQENANTKLALTMLGARIGNR